MAGAVGGENELIQITMLDFLSGRILLSCLVNPSKHIVDWREDITGINAVSMQEAVAGNKALHGWEAARAELWRFADKETILIGQSVHNDLKVLHTSHSRIIDSAVVTADAALGKSSKIRKRWGLETLCYEILGIQIRKPSQTGGRGVHDALEDAFATRELVLLCAREPNKLKRWGEAARAAFFKGNSSKRKPQGARRSQTKRTFQSSPIVEETDSTDDERLRWEDVVDPEVWPKSPPDSD
ncbi:exonuclease [Colletotrichum sublineola]|nr:exonuclease [Colletotrichum sublineola]